MPSSDNAGPEGGLRQPDEALREFVAASGLIAGAAPVRWTPLAGGVSSDIWRVDAGPRSFCVKRALPQLKVGEDWRVPIERNAYEWAWLSFAARHAPHAVPEPLAHDAASGVFAMSFLDPERYPVWKQRLLQGRADSATATAAASTLVRWHAVSAGDASLERQFPTGEIFHRIRLEPYLLATAGRHPRLAAQLQDLAARTAATHVALVHGDVSPKNILVGPEGPVFLDAECAWYGDPAFDLAFCLNHFLLKCLARRAATGAYLACFDAFAAAYLEGVCWEPAADLEARAARLLPGLFLARIDGQSPVEYVTAASDKALVRAVAGPLIDSPGARLEEICLRWRRTLEKAASF